MTTFVIFKVIIRALDNCLLNKSAHFSRFPCIIEKILVSLPSINNITRMKTIIRKEEALRRLKATKQIKKERIEVLRKRMCEKYEAKMGCSPQNVLFL